MKHYREIGRGIEIESINTANCLIMLSHGGGTQDRVYECKTCRRQFPSFQALGGHRASHKKPKLNVDLQTQMQNSSQAKTKSHECSICGLEFSIGQALGGHMRRHRSNVEALSQTSTEKKTEQKRELVLDLNLPPSDESDLEFVDTGFSVGFVKEISLIDCFN